MEMVWATSTRTTHHDESYSIASLCARRWPMEGGGGDGWSDGDGPGNSYRGCEDGDGGGYGDACIDGEGTGGGEFVGKRNRTFWMGEGSGDGDGYNDGTPNGDGGPDAPGNTRDDGW